MRTRAAAPTLLFLLGLYGIATSARAQLPTQRDIAGLWRGSANLINNSEGVTCDYRGGISSVTLNVTPNGAIVTGNVTIDIPATEGTGCPALAKNYVYQGTVSGTRLTATVAAGHQLSLSFTTELMGGTLTWTGDAPDEALAIGAVAPNGNLILTRLQGTLTLRRPFPDEIIRTAPPKSSLPVENPPAAPAATAGPQGAPDRTMSDDQHEEGQGEGADAPPTGSRAGPEGNAEDDGAGDDRGADEGKEPSGSRSKRFVTQYRYEGYCRHFVFDSLAECEKGFEHCGGVAQCNAATAPAGMSFTPCTPEEDLPVGHCEVDATEVERE